MSKHTPGPWAVVRMDDYDGPSETMFVEKIGPFMIEWHDDLNQVTPDRIEADIALVSAAPDLLAALIGLDEAFCNINEFSTREERHGARIALITARAAVAKAKGEAP